jgi:HSP20 family protein
MANLMRWDPFSELPTLQDRVNQLFSQSFSGAGRNIEQSMLSANFIPPVDVYEDDHTITLQAEIPGITEKDLDVRMENNILTISGERKLENEEKKENFHRIERQYGRFTRSFTLPSVVDPESVNADFENGVLKITIAKREETKPKQIKIGSKHALQTPTKTGKAA